MSATMPLEPALIAANPDLECYCLWYFNVACPNEIPLRTKTMNLSGCAFHCVRRQIKDVYTPAKRVRYITLRQGGIDLQITLEELWVVAQTIYGETDHDNDEEMMAVAWVIRNRMNYISLRTQNLIVPYIKICRAAGAFTCWLDEQALLPLQVDNANFMMCLMMARNVLDDQFSDPTRGALYYGNDLPGDVRIGQYTFVRDLEYMENIYNEIGTP